MPKRLGLFGHCWVNAANPTSSWQGAETQEQDLVPQFSGGAIHSEPSTWAQKPSRVTSWLQIWGAQTQLHKLWRRQMGSHHREEPQSKQGQALKSMRLWSSRPCKRSKKLEVVHGLYFTVSISSPRLCLKWNQHCGVLRLSTCQAVETRFSMMTEIKIKSTNMLGARHVLHICIRRILTRLYVVTIPKKVWDVEMLSVQCEEKTYTLVNDIFCF